MCIVIDFDALPKACLTSLFALKNETVRQKGEHRDLNPGPELPESPIIPLDHVPRGGAKRPNCRRFG